MGCDIHLLIEYDEKGVTPFSENENIESFSDGEIYVSRNYFVFNAMAGVRGDGLQEPIIAAKGFPEKSSHEAIKSYYSYVVDEGEKIFSEEHELRENADEYVAKGYSHYRDHHLKEKGWVSCPDWHSASWLTYQELMNVINVEYIDYEYFPKELNVVISALESIEKNFGKNRSRVVFWFDN